jgi:serine/threonine-protein kinase
VVSDLQRQLQELLGSAYHIDRELGGGGMSRVFVATETELERQVVIKVLPPELAAELNVDRFRREIQLAARLQHPHIVQLFTAGAKGSLLYYTMPFINGENLRARLARTGELPVQEAVRYLREIADALSYAHSQGVVHRDIKPENIIISGSHALVLDFGVSKALSSSTSEAPVQNNTLTSLGVALGTPAYMAPEQAAADPGVDARADIYALGIVGYELLAGRTPFSGLNQQQTLAAHITTAPLPVTQLRPQLPQGLAATIMRCIEKRPSDRWQSAAELHAALEPYMTTSGATAPALLPVGKRFEWTTSRIAVTAGIAGLAITGLIAGTLAFRNDKSSLTVGATHQITNDAGLEIHPAISPDGKLIAYSVSGGATTTLFVKSVSGGRAVAVADGGGWPHWSTDGTTLFFNNPKAENLTVPALGGVATRRSGFDSLAICIFSHVGDRAICTNIANGNLELTDSDGGNRHVVKLPQNTDGTVAGAWSPDDALIALTMGNVNYFFGHAIGNIAPSSVWVIRADGSEPVQITDHEHLNANPIFTPDGSLLYISNSGGTRDIYVQRLSSSHAGKGDPVRLTTGLNPHTISIDRDGKTVAYSAFTTSANVWSVPIPSVPVDNPVLKQNTVGNQTIESAAISNDGKWLLYDSNVNGNQDIFKVPIEGGEPVQLTHNRVDNFTATWSPDDKNIAYHALVNGNRDIYVSDASGGTATLVVSGPGEQSQPVWMPDGSGIYYYDGLNLVKVVRRDAASGKWQNPVPIITATFALIAPDMSALIAFANDNEICAGCASGIYTARVDGSARRKIATPKIDSVLATAGAIAWSRDSRHAYMVMKEKGGSGAIWQLPVNGDTERRLVHFTDPLRRLYRLSLDIDTKNFYVTIGDRQSDIWTLELKN